MCDKPNVSLEPTAEQIRYANVLGKCMYLGLACLFITFALYVTGIMEPHVPLEDLPQHWTKDVNQYLADVEVKGGWSWVGMIGRGDFVNFIGIVILAGATILCYLTIIPTLIGKKDTICVVIAILEVVVLATAASGIIAVGH